MTPAQTPELLPCPFCGGEWVQTCKPANGSQPHIICKACNARGPFTAGMTEQQWVAAWNTRQSAAASSRAEMARLVEALERIAGQRKSGEMDPDTYAKADFVGGFDAVVEHARAALSHRSEGEG